MDDKQSAGDPLAPYDLKKLLRLREMFENVMARDRID